MKITQIRMQLLPIFRVKLSDRLPFTELKFAVRNVARDNPLYFTPIEFDSFEWDGEVDLSNFGRWLFGIKGFAGHWKNTPADDEGWVDIYLPNIQEAVELIEFALNTLKSQGVILDYKKTGKKTGGKQ